MAKKMYRANRNFMFRIPTSHYIETETTKEELLNLCKDKCFREKIMIASPSLLQMIDTYFEEPDKLSEKKEKEMFASIEKYYRRSMERTTPFGLFAGVGMGRFDEVCFLNDEQQKFCKCVHPDAAWMWEYIAKMEQTYYARLSFKWNTVCIPDGNRDLLLYTTTQDVEEISVRRTAVLEIVKALCKEYTPYTKLVEEVQKRYQDVDKQVIERYLSDLIQKQILISNLRPTISEKEPFKRLVTQLEKIDASSAVTLKKIESMCGEYEKTAIGEGCIQYEAIICEMKKLHESKYYLQVDTNIYDAEMVLPNLIKRQIEQLAQDLVMLSSISQKQKEPLNWYRDKFVEKYGVNRLVPLTEMLDTSIGIGAPIGYQIPTNDFYESSGSSLEIDKAVRNYFLREYENAIQNHTAIKIDMEELGEHLHLPEQMEEPASFELYIKVREENGKIRLFMSDSGGAAAAGKTFGRFAIKNREFSKLLPELNEQEKAVRGNLQTCEISYLPARLRNGNVMRCPSGRDKVLSAYVGGNNDKEELCLEHILIGVDNGRFYAVDVRTGERLVFGMNNMYNLLLQPNIYRFLLEIANDGEANCFDLPWKYIFQYMKHIPQIELGDIVLASEQWFVSTSDLRLFNKVISYEAFQKAFEQYQRDNNLPRELYLVEEDNRISLNLNNAVSLHILFDELKKKKGNSVLLERKEAGEEPSFGASRFATEIVVPVFRNTVSPTYHSTTVLQALERKAHIALPYDNWLYFKLYCKHERETELIALELKQFAEKLKIEKGIEHFFMRYIDTKPHIRLRFYGNPQALYEATPDMMNWISDLEEKNIIGEMSIHQYEREVERYGGRNLIVDAEAVFRADSVIVENILQLIRMKQTELTVEEATILSVIKYLEAFYDHFEQWLDFCTAYYHSNQYLVEFRQKKERYLTLFDVEDNWSSLVGSIDGKKLLELVHSRNEVVRNYRANIEKENAGKGFKDNIVASVLHLHCNRMLGTDREWEQKIMSFVESLLYAKKHLYKERNRNEES